MRREQLGSTAYGAGLQLLRFFVLEALLFFAAPGREPLPPLLRRLAGHVHRAVF